MSVTLRQARQAGVTQVTGHANIGQEEQNKQHAKSRCRWMRPHFPTALDENMTHTRTHTHIHCVCAWQPTIKKNTILQKEDKRNKGPVQKHTKTKHNSIIRRRTSTQPLSQTKHVFLRHHWYPHPRRHWQRRCWRGGARRP